MRRLFHWLAITGVDCMSKETQLSKIQAVFSKDVLIIRSHGQKLLLSVLQKPFSEQDEWETLVESESGSNETTSPSLRLTGWYSVRGKCARSLIGLSEKSGTWTRVSPTLGFTKERVKLISDLPLSSLYSSKIPGLLVLCSNPFCNLASIICSVPGSTSISLHKKNFQYLSISSISQTTKVPVS